MCLIINKDQQPLIAEKNIPCYKELKNDNTSEQYGFQYEKGVKTELLELTVISGGGMSFTSGLWSAYPNLKKGYHSYTPETPHYKRHYKRYWTHLFVIPAGAKYYQGGINDSPYTGDGYVSNTIIFVGKNNWWNRFWQGRKYGVTFEPNRKSVIR